MTTTDLPTKPAVAAPPARARRSPSRPTVALRVKPLRRLIVALHVITSVGWLSLAVAQTALGLQAFTSTEQPVRWAALSSAEFLDHTVLVPAALTAAYTGLMLSALTSWGLLRFWWVATKLVITLGGLTLGIGWMNTWLQHGAAASATGGGPVTAALYWGAAMIVALIGATWLSIAKPWGRTRPARKPHRDPDAPAAIWLAALLLPALDYLAGLHGGLCLLTVLGYAGYRTWQSRRARHPRPTATTP